MNPPPALLPAEPVFRADGTLYSPQYEDVYASADGALAEAAHVFLRGNGLPERWRGRNSFVVVETGFGAGLNFLATWAAWRAYAPPGARLHYISVEKHPLRRDALLRMQSAWPEVARLAHELSARYPPLVPGFHRLPLGDGVTLTLLLGDVLPMLRQLEARANAFYLDGFAPARNPEMWSEAVLRELGRLAAPGATAGTYSVAGAVRAGLTAAGFSVERCAGFGSKREMLTARFAGDERAPAVTARTAAVVGAGLAGTACAAHLVARGWNVQLIERHDRAAREASGNPAGLVMPAFSLDWNPSTRLTTQAFVYATQWLDSLRHDVAATAWARAGVLQLARDNAHFERQRRIVQTFALPDDLIRLVSTEEGSVLAGAAVAGPGWWLPSAGWADPASVCLAHIALHSTDVRCLFGREAMELRRAGNEWQVLEPSGAVIAQAAVVVLANAHAARQLRGCEWMPLGRTRGQVSSLAAAPGQPLRAAVCREGFITPAVGGLHCIGASYGVGSEETQTTGEAHAGNLQRLERLLPGFAGAVNPAALEGRAAFRTVSPDRMPLAGRLRLDRDAEGDGLFACLGLASRGLTWAPLLGETIACLAGGEPLPLERDVMRWLDPARFSERA